MNLNMKALDFDQLGVDQPAFSQRQLDGTGPGCISSVALSSHDPPQSNFPRQTDEGWSETQSAPGKSLSQVTVPERR